jgi:hypothetical protein
MKHPIGIPKPYVTYQVHYVRKEMIIGPLDGMVRFGRHRRRRRTPKGPDLRLPQAGAGKNRVGDSLTFLVGGPQVGRVDDFLELSQHRWFDLCEEPDHGGVVRQTPQVPYYHNQVEHVLIVFLLHQLEIPLQNLHLALQLGYIARFHSG